MKYSKEFKSSRNHSMIPLGEYTREYLWGCYIKWQVREKTNRTFERFCKGWLNQ
jgi:hypothetical protein